MEEEEDVGAFVTEAAPFASEPTVVPETVDKLDTSTDAYDFKEYDLKEYDLGEVDGRLYDYGAYDEYGTATPELTATDDKVGPGVAAETDISENTVSTTLTRRPRVGSGMFRGFRSLSVFRCMSSWFSVLGFDVVGLTRSVCMSALGCSQLHQCILFPLFFTLTLFCSFSLHVFNLHTSLSWLI